MLAHTPAANRAQNPENHGFPGFFGFFPGFLARFGVRGVREAWGFHPTKFQPERWLPDPVRVRKDVFRGFQAGRYPSYRDYILCIEAI